MVWHDVARMFEASDFSSRSSFFCCIGANASTLCSSATAKIVTQNWGIDLLFAKFMLPLRWNQNHPVIEGRFEP